MGDYYMKLYLSKKKKKATNLVFVNVEEFQREASTAIQICKVWPVITLVHSRK